MASYQDVLARNLKAFRNRRDIGQELLAARMRNLGYSAWRSTTVAKSEAGARRLTAEEILGLAYALGITMRQLLAPQPDDKVVEFPSGRSVEVLSVQRLITGAPDGAVTWDGAEPDFPPTPGPGLMSVPDEDD